MPSLEVYSVWQPPRSPGSAWVILILIDIDRLLKSSGLSRLELSYARQHLFPEELERAHGALWIFSSGTLKGEVDHPSAHFIAAALDLLHDRSGLPTKFVGRAPSRRAGLGTPAMLRESSFMRASRTLGRMGSRHVRRHHDRRWR